MVECLSVKLSYKMKKSLFYVVSLLCFVFSACVKENAWSQGEAKNKIYFSSSIAGLPQTRVNGNQWGVNDEIGIFMGKHGVALTAETVLEKGFNAPYLTPGNGNFTAKNVQEALAFPKGQTVDFVAYYPYNSTHTLTPKMDVAEQKNQDVLDFMVAQNKSGLSKGLVELSFERQMTKVQLTVQGTDLAGLKARFVGLSTSGEFDLSTNQWKAFSKVKDIQANVSQRSAQETVVEWTLFPGKLPATAKVIFTKADGKTFTWALNDGRIFAAGHRYQYDITLGKDGSVIPTPVASYMELPVIKTSANVEYNLKMSNPTRRNYSMLYDTKYKVAYWVAYPLSNDYLGSQDRTDKWAYDPAFDNIFQANLSKGYPDNSVLQLDRGHQLPSGDRTATFAENASTFYYTNMTPQNRNLNQQLWQELESKIRTWTKQADVDTMYVVTGAMLTTKTDTKIDFVKDNSDKDVAKPKYYYKALAMKKGNKYYTIGFRLNNVSYPNREFMNHTVTVEELEKETGFTFFPALSKEVKSTIDNTIWKK